MPFADEMFTVMVPVIITEADIESASACPGFPGGLDPRSSYDEWLLPYALYFLGWVAQWKSMMASTNAERFAYERLLYAYHETADEMLEL